MKSIVQVVQNLLKPYIDSNIQTLTNNIAIVENGNTCTHTGGISKGQYVIWKGVLYTADSAISVGQTFASSGGGKNLTACSNGGLNELNNKFTKNTFGTPVEITGGYTASADGYLQIGNGVDKMTDVVLYSPDNSSSIHIYVPKFSDAIVMLSQTFVRKGTNIVVSQKSHGGVIYFIPLI